MLKPRQMAGDFNGMKNKNALIASFDKYRDADGRLDARKYLEDNMEIILSDLLNPGRGIPSKKSEMILKILDIYKDKQEITQKVELTHGDISRDAEQIIGYFRERYKESGVCIICERPHVLLEEVCSNQIN